MRHFSTHSMMGAALGLALAVRESQGAEPPPILSLDPRVTNHLLIAVEGTNVAMLWHSLAIRDVRSGETKADRQEWQLTLPADTPPGLAVLRFDTTQKLGKPMVILVDPLPTAPERITTAPMDRATGRRLSPPQAVEGALTGNLPHYFQLDLATGASVDLEVVSQRLGYPLDSRLRILDSTGKECARADESPLTGLDAALRFTAAQADRYWVELTDTRPAGDSVRPYRLRIGRFTPGPMRWLPSIHPLREETRGITVRTVAGAMIETDVASTELPLRVTGMARPPGARDVFRFPAGANEKIRLDLADRSWGSAGDFIARLEDLKGQVLAETDLSKQTPASLTHTFATEGFYRLVVEEATQAGGPGYDYQLQLRRARPEFLLELSETSLEGTPGSTVELKFTLQRHDYDGPVHLALTGLPGNVAVTGGEIASKSTGGTLKLQLPDDLHPGAPRMLTVIGRADIDGIEVSTTGSTRGSLRKQWMELNNPPPSLDGIVWLVVKSPP